MTSTNHDSASGIQFGPNLQKQAVSHIQFLKRVAETSHLKQLPVLRRAIYRYEKYWLPLAAEYQDDCLSAPLDIEWVWHCHLLSPKAYEQDCRNVVGQHVNHTLRDPKYFESAQRKSQRYWSNKYPSAQEQFHVDYSAPYDTTTIESFKSMISYDILSATKRQGEFYYQASLPHYQDSLFLESCLFRYQQFVYLKLQLPEQFLVPCYDMDLMWHTHQLNPVMYKRDMIRILGRVLNHDDTTTDRNVGSKLSNSTDQTRKQWLSYYNEPFSIFGAMYRGSSPPGILQKLVTEELDTICTRKWALKFDQVKLTVSTSNSDQYKNASLYGYMADDNHKLSRLFKWKRPSQCQNGSSHIVWTVNDKEYSFNGKCSNIKFSLKEKTGLLCGTTKVDHGSNAICILPLLETKRSIENGGNLHERIQLGETLSLEVKLHWASPLGRGCALLSLQQGRYEMITIPEKSQEFWGPISIDWLPRTTDDRCQVASHRLTNHMGNVEFTAKVIHSAPLMMSVIQIYHHDKMCASGHLIATEQLPQPTQVNCARNQVPISLNPKRGERAVLIKNSDGDWGIVIGRWEGYRKAVAADIGHSGENGCSGTLCIRFYKLSTGNHCESLVLGYLHNEFVFNMASVRVDLTSGSLQIDSSSNEVAENIALAFSVSLLHVLCVPRPGGWKEGHPVNPPEPKGGTCTRTVTRMPSDDMALIHAAGLLISAPSNYYFHNLHGKCMCAMYGGATVPVWYDCNDPDLPGSSTGYGQDGCACGGDIGECSG